MTGQAFTVTPFQTLFPRWTQAGELGDVQLSLGKPAGDGGADCTGNALITPLVGVWKDSRDSTV